MFNERGISWKLLSEELTSWIMLNLKLISMILDIELHDHIVHTLPFWNKCQLNNLFKNSLNNFYFHLLFSFWFTASGSICISEKSLPNRFIVSEPPGVKWDAKLWDEKVLWLRYAVVPVIGELLSVPWLIGEDSSDCAGNATNIKKKIHLNKKKYHFHLILSNSFQAATHP